MAHPEDGAHASGQIGEMLLAVRKDTAAALAGTDGDYAPLEVDATGHLYVVSKDRLLEDAAHTSGDPGLMILTVREPSPTALAGTNGDYQPLITDSSGQLFVVESEAAAMAADIAETNLFTSSSKQIAANLEFLALNNTQGTTEIHANTASYRFALMGIQGATNTTGATISIQDRTSGTVLIGPIPTIANTCIAGFPVTGFPYTISSDSTGLQIVVSGSARFDGVLQFLQIADAS